MPCGLVAVGQRAVGRHRDLAAVAGEARAGVGAGGRGHHEAEAVAELRAGAGRLQHRGRLPLVLHRRVGGRGDRDGAVLHRVVQRGAEGRVGDPAAAEGHVDRLGTALGGGDEPGDDAPLAEVRADHEQPAVAARAGDAERVVRARAGERRDVRAVPVRVGRRRAGLDVVEVDRVGDLALQVGVRRRRRRSRSPRRWPRRPRSGPTPWRSPRAAASTRAAFRPARPCRGRGA